MSSSPRVKSESGVSSAAVASASASVVSSPATPNLRPTRAKPRVVKREHAEPGEDEDEEEEDGLERKESVKREDAARPSKRAKREVKDEPADDENEDATMADAGGDSQPAPPDETAAPANVHVDRVRWLQLDGKRVPVTVTPWQGGGGGAAAKPAAAASSSSSAAAGGQCVVYWMTREQRVEDNWCLLYAQQIAREKAVPLRVVFSLVPKFLDATERMYAFMLAGLKEVEAELRRLDIPFEVLVGYAFDTLPAYAARHRPGAVVTCFGPLRISKEWTRKVAAELDKASIPLLLVDGHNVVPVWTASEKLEYAARTIRPKITRRLPEFLTEFPRVRAAQPPGGGVVVKPEPIDWNALDKSLEIDRRVKPVAGITPGTKAAFDTLHAFIRSRLHHYATKRNDPNAKHQSGLSPYLHFGQIAPQRCALEVNKYRGRHNASVNAFIEELVVRRELSDNFCLYNEKYDSIDGASAWARDSLMAHAGDKRTHVYSLGQWEFGVTHDPLWNASQLQLVHEGKLHGFQRMYWAKKILEYSSSPQVALSTAIYLNDRYSLDGRDPNGYVGCAWSILGIHDMGWAERPVFGKIRYMNYDGCKRKFDVKKYAEEYARYGSVPGSMPFVANQKKARERDEEMKQKKDAGSKDEAKAAAPTAAGIAPAGGAAAATPAPAPAAAAAASSPASASTSDASRRPRP